MKGVPAAVGTGHRRPRGAQLPGEDVLIAIAVVANAPPCGEGIAERQQDALLRSGGHLGVAKTQRVRRMEVAFLPATRGQCEGPGIGLRWNQDEDELEEQEGEQRTGNQERHARDCRPRPMRQAARSKEVEAPAGGQREDDREAEDPRDETHQAAESIDCNQMAASKPPLPCASPSASRFRAWARPPIASASPRTSARPMPVPLVLRVSSSSAR